MKTILAATRFTLFTAALSILTAGLAPITLAVAEPNLHGYVNYRNYDDGPESVAAFRARHHVARLIANTQPEPSIPAATSAPDATTYLDHTATATGEHCDLASPISAQNDLSNANC